MRSISALLVVSFLLIMTPASFAKGGESHFGSRFSGEKRADLVEIKSSPRTYVGKRVRIQGRVADVCKNSGCWLVVSDGEELMKVTIKNHLFSVPRDIDGRKVVVEGLVTSTRGRQPVISVVATGVEVQ